MLNKIKQYVIKFFKHRSKAPWVSFESYEMEGDQLKIELDWNDAFVDLLRSTGYVGASDEVIVRKWMSYMSDKIQQDMGNMPDFE